LIPLARSASPGRPLRLENEGNGQRACGWIISPEDIFDRDAVLDTLGAPGTAHRVKGVFHCADDWWLINRSGSDTSIRPTAYRRDSRVEVITDDPELNWEDLEAALLGCLVLKAP
jgi:hypothetical protein